MNDGLLYFIGVAIVLIGAVAIFGVILQDSKKKVNKKVAEANKRLKTAKRFKYLTDNFLTRDSFRKVVDQIAALSIYNIEEVQELSVKYYTTTLGLCLIVILIGIIVFLDVIATLLCCVFSMVMFNVLIMKRVDAVHFAVIKEFSATLSSIRETYTIAGNIPDAIEGCHTGKLLPKALDRIYLILTATDAEDRLEEFYRTIPFPMLQTLAGVCYILNDAGDEYNEKGVSAFKNALTLLKNEADLEIRKLTQQKMMFSFLEYLPLAPLPFVGVLKWFLTSYMPGTAVVLNGITGFISQTCIILASIFAYWYITTVCSPSIVRRDDRSDIVMAFRYWKPFSKYMLPDILPKKAKVRAKLEKELKGALSNKDIPYIYASKVLASVITFIATFTFICIFTGLARQFAYNNIQSASFLADTGGMTLEEEAKKREVDATVMSWNYEPSTSTLINNGFLQSYYPEMSAMERDDEANRLISKWKTYHGLRFHWWYVLLAYGTATFAWFAPGIMLDIRKKLVLAEEEEDVLQLQTMLAILRYTNMEVMQALYWLSRQSQIHRTAITYAYHEYPSDPELSIERLRDKSNLPEFKQICERLLSCISQVTLKEAFADLEAERDHMLRIRELVQTQQINSKRAKCSPISQAPLWVMVVGHFIVPIGVLAFNEIMTLAPQLGF